jgi:hypothetical protein
MLAKTFLLAAKPSTKAGHFSPLKFSRNSQSLNALGGHHANISPTPQVSLSGSELIAPNFDQPVFITYCSPSFYRNHAAFGQPDLLTTHAFWPVKYCRAQIPNPLPPDWRLAFDSTRV